MIKFAYSYHTFLLPFIFDTGSKDKSFEEFEKNLPNGWKSFKLNLDNTKELSEIYGDIRLFYNEYKYFHEEARQAIYTFMFQVKEKMNCFIK